MIVAATPRQHVELAARTSLKVGGPADWYSEPRDLEALRSDLAFAVNKRLPIKVIGGGSNLLISDDGVDGLVIRPLLQERSIDVSGDQAIVRVCAGASIGALARSLARQGWSGLEWAATVPGSVGGAVVNNAGAFGSSTAECLLSATLLLESGEIRTFRQADLSYGYRASVMKRGGLPGAVVLDAHFAVHKTSPSEAQRTINEFQAQRTASQPRMLSAGSVFANPPGDYSGRLLEAAGAKGMRKGAAEISRQHANFIVNRGGASARDIFELMVAARDLVADTSGLLLEAEIELAGRWSELDRNRLRGEIGR